MGEKEIFKAVKDGQNQKVIQFIRKNMKEKKNLEIKDSHGWNLIHWAIQKNNFLLVQNILRVYPEWFLEQKTGKGIFNGDETPLILASKKKNQQIVLFLLKSGAHLQSKQINGQTAWQILQFNFNQPFLFKALEISQKRKFVYKKAIQKQQEGDKFQQLNKLKQAQNSFLHAKQHFQTLSQIDICSEQFYKKKYEDIQQKISDIKILLKKKEIDNLLQQSQQFLKQKLLLKVKENIIICRIKTREIKQMNINAFKQIQDKLGFLQTKLTQAQQTQAKQKAKNQIDRLKKQTSLINHRLQLLQFQKQAKDIIKKYRINRPIGVKQIEEVLKKYELLQTFGKNSQNQQNPFNKSKINNKNSQNFYKLFQDILLFQRNQLINNQNLTQFQLKLHYALAVLSKFVYPAHENQELKFTHFSNILSISQIAKTQKVWNNYRAGYLAKAFHIKIGNQQIVIISHCGTVDTQNGDIAADFLLLFDLIHIQLFLAQQFTKKVLKIVQQKKLKLKVYQTGHSLGGILAQICALQNDLDAITFECPGSYDLFIRTDTKHSKRSKITSYLTAPNIINTLKPHIGKCYRLYDNNNPSAIQKKKQQQKIQSLKQQQKQEKQKISANTNIITKNLYKAISIFYDTAKQVKQDLSKKIDKIMPQNMMEKFFPDNLNNLLKRFNKLSQPLAKLIEKDINLHSIDSIVKIFEKSVIQYAQYQSSSNFVKQINLNRKIIQEWPVGPVQYFSFMTLMIQENCFQPDQLCKSQAFKYLSKRKNVYYKIRPDLEAKL